MIEYIGYWSDGKNNFPMPIENEVSNNDESIKKLEAILEYATIRSYRGWSTCRCCKKMNGSKQYYISSNEKEYAIPEGYKHYLLDHKVKPSSFIDQLYNELILKKKEDLVNTFKKFREDFNNNDVIEKKLEIK